MPDMSSDQIRDIAIRCVEGFLNDKISLSEGLAKEASANNLNLEQIKRACEATNTVTHLKLMQLSDDRTVEFPLCKVAEVMQEICTPDLSKTPVIDGDVLPIEKTASVQEAPLELSTHEKTLEFIKQAAFNQKELDRLRDRAVIVQSELVKAASQLRADPTWLDKMSSIDTESFDELSVLVSGEKAVRRDFGGHCLFKEAQLRRVKELAELYKEAKTIVYETIKRENMQKQASALRHGMVKQAFLGELAEGAGSAIGKALGGAAKKIGSAVTGAAGMGIAGGKALNKGVGSVVGAKHGIIDPVSMGVDGLTYVSSGGAGSSKDGVSRDVWSALQH